MPGATAAAFVLALSGLRALTVADVDGDGRAALRTTAPSAGEVVIVRPDG